VARKMLIQRRVPEGSAEIQRALELDPFSPIVLWMAGRLASWAGDHERAIELLRRAMDLSPQSPRVRWWLRDAYAVAGREKEAAETLLAEVPSTAQPELRSAYEAGGLSALLERYLRFEQERTGLPCGSPAGVGASLYAQLGDAEGVFRCLELAARTGDVSAQAPVNTLFAPYRSDPRWAAYLAAMNLSEVSE
jgi:tetratricopeptide (TPR) repeat protein